MGWPKSGINWKTQRSSALIQIDILQRLGDRFFFRLLEKLLKPRFEHFGFVLLRFRDLLIFLVAAGGW